MRSTVVCAARAVGRGTRSPPPVYRPSIKTRQSTLEPSETNRQEQRPFRRSLLVFAGVQVFIFTAYGAYQYSSYKKSVQLSKTLNIGEDVSDRYDRTAANFDKDVGSCEMLQGIGRKRKRMLKLARGEVLEVSVGTGRNIRFYPWHQLKGLTLIDSSGPMMDICRKKLVGVRSLVENVNLITMDATSPIPKPTDGYDTVVETFGLCSVSKPVELLKNLGTVCNPNGGQILLLEHGRSHYNWLNSLLDNLAPAHADRHGCWWNRDIGKIIEQSDLEVVKLERYDLGTTWWVELRPRPRSDKSSSKPVG